MKTKTIVALTLALGAGLAFAAAAQEPTAPAAEVKRLLDEARSLGAKGQLPLAWWDLDERFDKARDDGAPPATWEDLRRDARLLRNRAAFVDEMRRRKGPLEAMLGRFDQALREVAALQGIDLDPTLTGTALADQLLARLDAAGVRRRVQVDSLTVANRRLQEAVGGRLAAQDSVITALRAEASDLRKKLWETELRVGVAEADRSAAETLLTRRQKREDAIEQVRASFDPAEAEALITPAGELVLRVHGLAFDVGSARVRPGQGDLVARLAAAIERFPGAPVRVEGHTDATGSRDANLRLSRRRAETVAALLADRLGRDPATIATEGFGPDRPVALNDTAEGRARNRRIDVVIGMKP